MWSKRRRFLPKTERGEERTSTRRREVEEGITVMLLRVKMRHTTNPEVEITKEVEEATIEVQPEEDSNHSTRERDRKGLLTT